MNHPRTGSCYARKDCDRPECRQRRLAYLKRYRLERARGAEPHSAEAARERLQMLLPVASMNALSQECGVSRTTLNKILTGKRKFIRPSTEKKILALTGKPTVGGPVPPLEAVRQLRALMAIGWSTKALSERSGVSLSNTHHLLRDQRSWLDAGAAARIRTMYHELEHTTGPSTYAVTRGRENGWAPPIAWDGVDMASPTARPKFGRNSHSVRSYNIEPGRIL